MKKTPLKYWAILAGACLLLVIGVLTIARVFVNAAYVNAYNEGDYDTSSEEKLIYVNYLESYLVYYNLGNSYYQKGEYLKAAGLYAEALKYKAPEGEDCQIRINYALSLCYSIDFDNLKTQSDIENALMILYTARDTLTENGCANDEGTGHNPDAQQLKEDIDKMIEKLENPDKDDNQDEDQNEDQNQDQDDNEQNENQNQNQSSKQKEQQEKLQQNKQGAQKERREEQQTMEKYQNQGGSGSEEDQGGNGEEGDGNGGSSSGTNPW